MENLTEEVEEKLVHVSTSNQSRNLIISHPCLKHFCAFPVHLRTKITTVWALQVGALAHFCFHLSFSFWHLKVAGFLCEVSSASYFHHSPHVPHRLLSTVPIQAPRSTSYTLCPAASAWSQNHTSVFPPGHLVQLLLLRVATAVSSCRFSVLPRQAPSLLLST